MCINNPQWMSLGQTTLLNQLIHSITFQIFPLSYHISKMLEQLLFSQNLLCTQQMVTSSFPKTLTKNPELHWLFLILHINVVRKTLALKNRSRIQHCLQCPSHLQYCICLLTDIPTSIIACLQFTGPSSQHDSLSTNQDT